jgi:putative endonuclease
MDNSPQRKFFVYILYSEKHDKCYVGSTSDLQKRFEHHNSNRARWTKKYRPWLLKYSEEFHSRSEARMREASLKASKNIKRFLQEKQVL